MRKKNRKNKGRSLISDSTSPHQSWMIVQRKYRYSSSVYMMMKEDAAFRFTPTDTKSVSSHIHSTLRYTILTWSSDEQCKRGKPDTPEDTALHSGTPESRAHLDLEPQKKAKLDSDQGSAPRHPASLASDSCPTQASSWRYSMQTDILNCPNLVILDTLNLVVLEKRNLGWHQNQIATW